MYSVIGTFFSFWPADAQTTAQTMNWTVLVFGGFMIFSVVFWLLHGRKVYTGPVLEINGDLAVRKG